MNRAAASATAAAAAAPAAAAHCSQLLGKNGFMPCQSWVLAMEDASAGESQDTIEEVNSSGHSSTASPSFEVDMA